MNDFTKEELESILEAFDYARYSAHWTKYHDEPLLINKIQSMIDNHDNGQEIFYCKTGLALSDEFFCQNQYMTKEDLMPVMQSLVNACDCLIKSSGIYSFTLKIERLK